MDQKTEKMFEEIFDMCATEGWKTLMTVVGNDLDTMNQAVWNTKDTDEVLRLQGHQRCLSWLANYEQSMEIAFEEAKREEEDAAEAGVELDALV